jgi:hypothetical protein
MSSHSSTLSPLAQTFAPQSSKDLWIFSFRILYLQAHFQRRLWNCKFLHHGNKTIAKTFPMQAMALQVSSSWWQDHCKNPQYDYFHVHLLWRYKFANHLRTIPDVLGTFFQCRLWHCKFPHHGCRTIAKIPSMTTFMFIAYGAASSQTTWGLFLTFWEHFSNAGYGAASFLITVAGPLQKPLVWLLSCSSPMALQVRKPLEDYSWRFGNIFPMQAMALQVSSSRRQDHCKNP